MIDIGEYLTFGELAASFQTLRNKINEAPRMKNLLLLLTHPLSPSVVCSGIYHDSQCNQEDINHAVLLVGYGVSARGKQYWIIKNRWVRWPREAAVMKRRAVDLTPPDGPLLQQTDVWLLARLILSSFIFFCLLLSPRPPTAGARPGAGKATS